jgi:hypothetical protein
MARPRIEINWVDFDKLCNIHCTLIEISEWFNCSEDTIERAVKREKGMGFADYYKKKSGRGKISIRRKMFDVAQSGNVTMLIWLSKQLLGYTDKVEQKQEITKAEVTIVKIPVNEINEIKQEPVLSNGHIVVTCTDK